LYFGHTLIRDAESVFCSNGVDQHVGCFHQDEFPFWLFLFESLLSLNDANLVTVEAAGRIASGEIFSGGFSQPARFAAVAA
jgi:hypothetical protein